MTQKATLHPPRVESDSDSDDAPEEFSSSLPQELSSTLVSSSGRSLSPKLVSSSKTTPKNVSKTASKAILELKAVSQETGETSLSQSCSRSELPKKSPAEDGQPVLASSKKGQPFAKNEDDMLYAFCQRHRHVSRADAPYLFFNLLKIQKTVLKTI